MTGRWPAQIDLVATSRGLANALIEIRQDLIAYLRRRARLGRAFRPPSRSPFSPTPAVEGAEEGLRHPDWAPEGGVISVSQSTLVRSHGADDAPVGWSAMKFDGIEVKISRPAINLRPGGARFLSMTYRCGELPAPLKPCKSCIAR